ncbi:MAG: protein-L-isoaspartate(D-aspartate) O-methyltransferase [Candidatus Aenigmatarchaeota archaeon]|nr:MAG: protein-L-isoaspartate(D-aspartate) O-methyltransferase [Candidatus Aenigmarchaeota archaeon]
MDYTDAQEALIAHMQDTGALTSGAVETAIRAMPRHLFVPPAYARHAYMDEPMPLAHGQTISQPSTVVVMTEALRVKPGQRVLEIGTGSGWQAALISYIVGVKGSVITIERFAELAREAKQNLRNARVENVDVRVGDGTLGVRGEKFDGIIVTAAAPFVPKPLEQQLKTGGRLVIPMGKVVQEMFVFIKTKKGLEQADVLGQFRFVPLVGKYGFQ